ncbi:hypothetical protein CISIN_1g034726mg [Citrus sinensis]|uniref:Uncharacterized protein n=1 Tax=Citrus sinensis TaxID=2711 RepID=A0A067DPJ8_CITSI|nr:hypothetical protein CISIN_1g034726mg [Citrus sinensis]KDO44748.1 hypothetical protein CISIN_1g034726mg [Citrus sinensis]KDO44749.1 hypothetical protein CISIN_1g034726mg [Citrus sinensis]
MDMKACVKELPQELARELLIAISNSVPEKHPSPDKHLPQRFDNANGVAVTNGDEAEKYRSDLISLSYVESPDVFNSLPIALANYEI